MGSGVQAASEVSEVLLLGNRPQQVVDAISLSQATLRKIRQNLVWAFGYNLIGIPLAAGRRAPARARHSCGRLSKRSVKQDTQRQTDKCTPEGAHVSGRLSHWGVAIYFFWLMPKIRLFYTSWQRYFRVFCGLLYRCDCQARLARFQL